MKSGMPIWTRVVFQMHSSNEVVAPGSGTGIDNPYDFLNVSVVPSFKEWGQNVDKLVTGGGAYSQSLYGELASCDTTRVYRTTYVGGYNPE